MQLLKFIKIKINITILIPRLFILLFSIDFLNLSSLAYSSYKTIVLLIKLIAIEVIKNGEASNLFLIYLSSILSDKITNIIYIYNTNSGIDSK